VQLTKPQLPLAPADSYAATIDLDRTAVVITVIGGASAILSAFMPWLETAAFGISLIKVEVAGALLAGLAAVSIGIACVALPRRAATTAVAIVLIVLGVAEVGLAIWHLESIVQSTSKADSRLVLISLIGTGLYLGVLGSVITLVGGILASILAWTRRSSPLQT
jgi:hypothetical protein